ncbi:glucose 1-dehydrogenase [Nocardia huaxiensis]|uniref:Glucose 1-dehydrogenase n=1 Tax=Nocardia huaxiensis TaxID=2755382 RepID=A0A7D6Z114_9NOCA|nr:glucose 1-dehydrogenase [Nocardia huaxiensis]QLY29826.1 glucose 1-dehydrogenase [Nocardia huaxiensis]UFS96584.1 glucose 1-dehydrogenase [Nocardia huaxiensis]
MRALTVIPEKADSLEVREVPDPVAGEDELLVRGVAFGVCGTDREIAGGDYGWAPPGEERLIIGHESLGRVLRAPDGSGFAAGDLVVGVVRRPDPVPCGACARGEFDMCRNDRYTERGIKQLHGYASELWTVETDYAVRLDAALEQTGVLMEPTTVVAKAWEQIDRVSARAWYEHKRVLVTGAGPIGLLAALLGTQRGLDVHVLALNDTGIQPEMARKLGATYHSDPLPEVADKIEPDVIVEATGAASVAVAAMTHSASAGIVCLTGVSPIGREVGFDAGAANRRIVLENDLIFGSVNANMRHYRQAAEALADADQEWLSGLITRRLPLDRAEAAFTPGRDDIKVAVSL